MSVRSFSENGWRERNLRTKFRINARFAVWLVNSSFPFFIANRNAKHASAFNQVMKPNWTLPETGCSVSRMWKTVLALLLFVTPAFAQERVTAYDALRVVGIHLNRDAVNHVISVTGAKGDPQPETWRVLLDDRAHGGIREIQVRNGRIGSERPSSTVRSAEG